MATDGAYISHDIRWALILGIFDRKCHELGQQAQPTFSLFHDAFQIRGKRTPWPMIGFVWYTTQDATTTAVRAGVCFVRYSNSDVVVHRKTPIMLGWYAATPFTFPAIDKDGIASTVAPEHNSQIKVQCLDQVYMYAGYRDVIRSRLTASITCTLNDPPARFQRVIERGFVGRVIAYFP